MEPSAKKEAASASTGKSRSATGKPSLGKPTGWRKWAYRFLALTLVPTVLFGLLEGGLRIGGYGYRTEFFLAQPATTTRDLYTENPAFGHRFFPPGLARQPLPALLKGHKPAGTYRIFILGESAAQGFPDPTCGFSRLLQVLLRERYPDTRFEVINTAMVAINSHVILPAARDCASLQPDLFIVYMGNNEVVGPFGAAGVIGPFSPNLSLIRTNLFLKTTRTGQLVGNGMQSLSAAKKVPHSWGGMGMFLQSQVPSNDPRLVSIYDHLRDNLQDICRVGTQAGARVIVCTIPVNLKDSAPFASEHRPELTTDEGGAWEVLYQEGVRLETAGNAVEAIERFEAASRLDDQYAELEFRLGRCLLALGQQEKARQHFVQARDLDTLRFRADTQINETIRAVAAARSAEGVDLVDAEQRFQEASPAQIPGEELFLEHVHLNFSGNYLLARSLVEPIAAILPASVKAHERQPPALLSEEECAEQLAYTAWNRCKAAADVLHILRQAPFTNQLDHADREQRWQAKVDSLRQQLQPDALQQAVATYQKAIQETPDDWMLRSNYAQLLLEGGDGNNALEQYTAILARDPHLFRVRVKLADLCVQGRAYEKAIRNYREALKVDPGFADAHFGLARALAGEGKVDEALALLTRRLRNDPDRSGSLERLAEFLVGIGKADEAKQRFTEALQVDPDNAAAHAQLGKLLAQEGAREEALAHYQEALRIRPRWPEIEEHLAALQQMPPKDR
jgi:tetratricopeptide (TPR) repeat protein